MKDIRIYELIATNGIFVALVMLAGVCLAVPTSGLLSAVAQTSFLMFYSYAGHVLAHQMPSSLQSLNPHMFIHHGDPSINRAFNLVSETLLNLACTLALLPLQAWFGLAIFAPKVVVYSAVLYTLVHIVDYSLIGSSIHAQHHAKSNKNYGPDWLDIVFGTQAEPDAPYYDSRREIIYVVMAAAFAHYFA